MADVSAYEAQSSLSSNQKAADGFCSVCSFIENFVSRPRNPRTIWVGKWKDFIDRVSCETCQQIVRYFETVGRPYEGMTMSCSLVLEDRGDTFFLECVRPL
jgi:hypothetical protein